MHWFWSIRSENLFGLRGIYCIIWIWSSLSPEIRWIPQNRDLVSYREESIHFTVCSRSFQLLDFTAIKKSCFCIFSIFFCKFFTDYSPHSKSRMCSRMRKCDFLCHDDVIIPLGEDDVIVESHYVVARCLNDVILNDGQLSWNLHESGRAVHFVLCSDFLQ